MAYLLATKTHHLDEKTNQYTTYIRKDINPNAFGNLAKFENPELIYVWQEEEKEEEKEEQEFIGGVMVTKRDKEIFPMQFTKVAPV